MGAAKDKPFSGPANVSQAEWDRIFGKPEPRRPGRYVTVDGKLVHEDDLPAEPVAESTVPAIHDHSKFLKKFDYGAGRKWDSMAQRREWMKRRDKECIG